MWGIRRCKCVGLSKSDNQELWSRNSVIAKPFWAPTRAQPHTFPGRIHGTTSVMWSIPSKHLSFWVCVGYHGQMRFSCSVAEICVSHRSARVGSPLRCWGRGVHLWVTITIPKNSRVRIRDEKVEISQRPINNIDKLWINSHRVQYPHELYKDKACNKVSPKHL